MALKGPRTEGFDLLREVRGCLPVKLEIELRSAGRGVYKDHGGGGSPKQKEQPALGRDEHSYSRS